MTFGKAWSAVRRPQIQWTGIIVAVVVALWAGTLVFVFSMSLAGVNVWLAPLTNLVAVGGLAPTVRRWRGKPVLRFLAVGLGFGVAAGWIALLVAALAS